MDGAHFRHHSHHYHCGLQSQGSMLVRFFVDITKMLLKDTKAVTRARTKSDTSMLEGHGTEDLEGRMKELFTYQR